jgi:RHS repeat-associated protein
LQDGDDTYQWDAAGRLTQATVEGVTGRFAYLGDGSRISMTVGGETTTYTLDVAAPLVQVLVANEDGIRTAYLYGIARIGEEDSVWQYYLADHLGSVRSLVDAEESVAGTRAYQPYGAPLSSAGAAESVYGFTGEQTDPTGLVYLRARMYAPGLELFLSRDPWGGDENRSVTRHGFSYANLNPLVFTDPSGQSPFCLLKREVDGTLTRDMDDFESRVCWEYLHEVERRHTIDVLTEPYESSPLQWQSEFPGDVTPPLEAGGLPYWDFLDLVTLDLGLTDLRRIVQDSAFARFFRYPFYDLRPGRNPGGLFGVTFWGLGADTLLNGKTTVWHEHWHQADFKWHFLGLNIMGGRGGVFAGLLSSGGPYGWYDWSGVRPSDIPSDGAPGGRAYQDGTYDMRTANAVEVFAELGTLYMLNRLGIEEMPEKYMCEMNRILWALRGNPIWQVEFCTDDC